nr:MAG TPA: hypothetical protein [Caudoviricetes sp.]
MVSFWLSQRQASWKAHASKGDTYKLFRNM